ncbi:MAG: hypothetical protein V3V08_10430 [Nannocystaceae bacterium]
MTSGDHDDANGVPPIGRTDPCVAADGPLPIQATALDAVAPVTLEPTLGANEAIAEGLATGTLSVEMAREVLVTEEVERILGRVTDPALTEEIRREITTLLEADPLIQRLLRPER